MPQHPSRPALRVHTPQRTSNAKIETSALPGTPLGGPYCTGRARPGCQAVRPDTLGSLHLTYLRAAYRGDAGVRAALDGLAAQYRYGRNSLAVFVLDEVVGENVLRAIQGLAAQLPYLEQFEGGRDEAVTSPELEHERPAA